MHSSFPRIISHEAGQYEEDLGRATGSVDVQEDFISNLSRISQLTGFSDPIYAEAYVKMHGFDIMLGRLLLRTHLLP